MKRKNVLPPSYQENWHKGVGIVASRLKLITDFGFTNGDKYAQHVP
jgi:hypothetical protein